MRVEVPRLQDYDVSPITGFLPEEFPLKYLEDPYFEPWETVVKELPAFNMTRKVREYVDKMPLLDAGRLKTQPEWRRACTVLGFLVHSYVWSGETPADRLPRQLSEPFMKVCDHFELPYINTYANMCLWNFNTVLPVESPDLWDLSHLCTNTTFTGCIDESWFYLVSTAIEKQGASCLSIGLDAIKATRNDDGDAVTRLLQEMAYQIDSLTTTLGRMYEMCDPHIFYYRLRPYLAGWKNMADAGLPNGVRYGDETTYRQYAGGSNAQSSLIQALDIILSVEHYPTGHGPTPKSADSKAISSAKHNSFIHEMRVYMPGPHRRFLEHLKQVSEIRDYVVENGGRFEGLTLAYDACLAMLRSFRDKHIQVVSRYIVLQAREGQRNKQKEMTKRQGLAAAKQASTGTGGSALIPFLKQARDETGDAAAGNWGRRLLSETRAPIIYASAPVLKTASSSTDKTALGAPKDSRDSQETSDGSVGLAGSWDLSNDKNINHW